MFIPSTYRNVISNVSAVALESLHPKPLDTIQNEGIILVGSRLKNQKMKTKNNKIKKMIKPVKCDNLRVLRKKPPTTATRSARTYNNIIGIRAVSLTCPHGEYVFHELAVDSNMYAMKKNGDGEHDKLDDSPFVEHENFFIHEQMSIVEYRLYKCFSFTCVVDKKGRIPLPVIIHFCDHADPGATLTSFGCTASSLSKNDVEEIAAAD